MVYSPAFEALRPDVREGVYQRMIDTLTRPDRRNERGRASAEDRRAVLEILRDTKSDFPSATIATP